MLLTVTLFYLIAFSAADVVSNILQANIPEDGLLNFTQLAVKYGRQCEEFDVETDDGYILKLFHITGNKHKKPVLLMHGILDSADTYIIRGNISIAINLAEAGYDVWAGNVRGNKYSTRHVKLSPEKDKKEFWDFSFNKMGVHDLPVIIDFVLKKTGKKKLASIGHSQGTTINYVLGSVKPEYNKKISVFISLAPIAYLSHAGPGVTAGIKLWPAINAFFKTLGYEGVLQDNSTVNELIQFICTQGELSYDLCDKGVASALAGADPEEFEQEFFDVLIGHFPAGTSRKAFAHYVQVATSARFEKYDYGAEKNRQMYNSEIAPVYNLSAVTMPIVLLAAKNDALSSVKDVERLKSELPNVVEYHVMEREKFNHIDYVWGKHLDVYMTPLLRDLLHRFT